jgi:hypothetical protein
VPQEYYEALAEPLRERGRNEIGGLKSFGGLSVTNKLFHRVMADYMPKVGSLGHDMMFRSTTIQVFQLCMQLLVWLVWVELDQPDAA